MLLFQEVGWECLVSDDLMRLERGEWSVDVLEQIKLPLYRAAVAPGAISIEES